MQKLRNTPSFGSNIRVLRKAAGLTQEQVVARLQLLEINISRSIYSQIECGTYNIRVEEIVALKEIFGASYDAFFEGIEEKVLQSDGEPSLSSV